MVQRYVWFDDVDRLEVSRLELRVPKPLHDFIRRLAEQQDVSVNAMCIGLLAYTADAQTSGRLVLEKVPSVRVTSAVTAGKPAVVPVLDAGPRGHVGYHRPKAR